MVAATAAHAAAAPTIPTPSAPALFDSLVPISLVSCSLICAHPHPLGCANSHLAVFIPAYPHLSPRHTHLATTWPLCLFDLPVPVSSVTRSLIRGHPHPLSCTKSHLGMFIPAHLHLSSHHTHLAVAWPLCLFDCTFVCANRLHLLILGLHLGSFRLWWGSLHALQPLVYVYIKYIVSKYMIIKQLTFKA